MNAPWLKQSDISCNEQQFVLKANSDIDTVSNKPCFESLLGTAELFTQQNEDCNQQGKVEPGSDIIIKYNETCLITESKTDNGKKVYTTQLCKFSF